MGHYLAARAFGIRVTKFYLFFDAWGFKLFSFKYGETEFGMGWLPLGGYCQISGMIDETQGTDDLASTPQSWEFRSKPVWQRLTVMFGGIFLNFVTGILVLSFLLLGSENAYLSNDEVSKYGILPTPLAKEIGFQSGDKIMSVNGKPIMRFQDAQSMTVLLGSDVEILRGCNTLNVTIPDTIYQRVEYGFFRPDFPLVVVNRVIEGSIAEQMGLLANDQILQINADTIRSFGHFQDLLEANKNEEIRCLVRRDSDVIALHANLDSTGTLGFFFRQHSFQLTDYTLGSAFVYGYKDAMDLLRANVRGFGMVFKGKVKATDAVAGPIGMAQIYGAKWIWSRFWYVTGILSLVFAFMNFLPIPALDGGHILFALWEMVTRRKPSDRFLMITQQIGMIIIFALMFFAISNDLFRIFR
jgi:regulator of sigma E protease